MLEINIKVILRNSNKDTPCLADEVTKRFYNSESLKEYLQERYGKIPNGKSKIYYYGKQGEAIECGITYSFWNDKKSLQTDWIEVRKIVITNITYKEALKKY